MLLNDEGQSLCDDRCKTGISGAHRSLLSQKQPRRAVYLLSEEVTSTLKGIYENYGKIERFGPTTVSFIKDL